MKILVSNDDGHLAHGIGVLSEMLSRQAEVVVVAPLRNHSGASNSLTLRAPLYVDHAAENYYVVDGTPSDCVHLALAGLLDDEPDVVVSGINHGANLGDDVIYSGTVAAAMEGRFLGLPAIAVSLVGRNPTHFDTAARVVSHLLHNLESVQIPDGVVLNVNVPDVPFDALTGIEGTRLGFRHRSEPMVEAHDPKGRKVYWIGPAGDGQDAGPGTDFYAIQQGAASVTPLSVDLTASAVVSDVMEWLKR